MPRISVRTLGTVTIDVGARRVGPSAGRLFALLLYLTSPRSRATSRRVLQELLFPRTDERQAAHSLRQLLYRLRRLGVSMEADVDRVEIRGGQFSVDWWEILERGELGAPDLERIAQGLFPGYSPTISEGFHEWFEAERSAVGLRLSRALGLQLAQLRRSGRWDLVDLAARALLALDPLSEEGTLARAESLAATGSKRAALGLIDDYLKEIGDAQPNLRLSPTALRRRISERLPDAGQRPQDERLFVGREDAMRVLSTVGTVTRSGKQQTLLIWGESGIGKTRLLGEYRALFSLQGGITALIACQPHDVYRPLGILCDLVAELLRAPGALGCDPGARQLLERLVSTNGQIGPTREDATAELPLPAIVRSFSDLVSAIGAESALLILVDDAQWIDRSSLLAMLGTFAGSATSRSCLVMASRDRALLTSADCYSDNVFSIRLNPLEQEPARELTRSLLKSLTRDKIETIERDLLEQARGNPFFIRLLCSHFIATNDAEALKHTVAEILERRLDQLSPETRRVLEACVVLGKNCTFARLEAMLKFPRLQLLQAIEVLDDRALVQITDGCFLTSHALLGAVVVRRTAGSVGRALHAAAAEVLQTEWASSHGESLAWDCAEHWRLAENHLQAAAVLRSCARRAFERGRPTDAGAILKRALELVLPDGTRLQIVQEALDALEEGINWKEATGLLLELRSLRRRLGLSLTNHDRYEVIEFARFFHAGGDPREHVRSLRACLDAPDAAAAHRLCAGRQLLMIAEVTLDRSLAELAHQRTRNAAPGTRSQLTSDVLFHTCFGDPVQARELAAELAERSLHNESVLPHALNAGYALYRVGEPGRAEAVLMRCLSVAQATGSECGEMHAYLFLARLCWSTRRYNESRVWYNKFNDYSTRYAEPDVLWEHNILGARLAIQEGLLEGAQKHLEQVRQSPAADAELPGMLLRASQIELRAAEGAQLCTDAELGELLSLHRRARGLGCHDEVMFSVIIALRSRKREGEGLQLLREYARSHRRDGFPLDYRLSSLVAENPLDRGTAQNLERVRTGA